MDTSVQTIYLHKNRYYSILFIQNQQTLILIKIWLCHEQAELAMMIKTLILKKQLSRLPIILLRFKAENWMLFKFLFWNFFRGISQTPFQKTYYGIEVIRHWLDRASAMHSANPGSVPEIPYSLPNTTLSNSWVQSQEWLAHPHNKKIHFSKNNADFFLCSWIYQWVVLQDLICKSRVLFFLGGGGAGNHSRWCLGSMLRGHSFCFWDIKPRSAAVGTKERDKQENPMSETLPISRMKMKGLGYLLVIMRTSKLVCFRNAWTFILSELWRFILA